MANPETLEKVYAAIGALRAKGMSRPDVGLVATTAGVARSTFYLEDEDWKEVRAVIKGKPSERVRLVQVAAEEKTVATRQIEALSARLGEAEKQVIHIQSTADKVYRELIDEVQRWFVKASEKPARQAQMARYIEELNGARKEMERLRSANRILEAQLENSNSVRPLVQKKKIVLYALRPSGELFASFLKQLDELFPYNSRSNGMGTAYLMCGLPCSGKTSWIEIHQPSRPGIHVYVDSCAHTADIRRFIADRLREAAKVKVHCVWLRTGDEICTKRVGAVDAAEDAILKEMEIRRVKSAFEAPAFDEPFDSIILP